MKHTRPQDDATDLSGLHNKLFEQAITHSFTAHPCIVGESAAVAALGFSPFGTHQIRVPLRGGGIVSIIRGAPTFGMFELYGGTFDCERFCSEDEVLTALKDTGRLIHV